MDSNNIAQARDLLLHLEPGEVISTQVNHEYNSRTGYDNYSEEVVTWLTENLLLVLIDVLPISKNSSVEIFKATQLGDLVAEFGNLADYLAEDSVDPFLRTGDLIYSTLEKYSKDESNALIMLITEEEKQAYNRYYGAKTQEVLIGRNNTNHDSNSNKIDELDFYEVLESGLSELFHLSVALGSKDTDETRTNNYVFKKCMEELGEMALEDQIENGLSYKEPGSDGVAGEAVDLAICAMDMFALQYPECTATEIQYLFLNYMSKKLEKWKNSIGYTATIE